MFVVLGNGDDRNGVDVSDDVMVVMKWQRSSIVAPLWDGELVVL